MTVASTNDYDPTIDAIIKGAMQLAGLMNSRESLSSHQHIPNASMCREYMADILDELPAHGVTLRTLRFVTQALTVGDYTYTLDAGIIDVIGAAMYIEPGETVTEATGETMVTQISQERWHKLSDHGSSGRPTQFFVYKGGTALELRLWPIPDAAGTIRFQGHTKSADSTDGSKQVDLDGYWRTYLKYEVAHRFLLANGADLQRAGYFKMLAAEQFKFALNKAQGRVATQMSVGHDTRWRR